MERSELLRTFLEARKCSADLCAPLMTEDYVVQTMPDVSPPKWNLAHTTWFFERVILQEHVSGYLPFHDQYYYLFNSYYQSLGNRWNRTRRGVVSRPTVEEVYLYRSAIDERVADLINRCDEESFREVSRLIELGIHHEQQHQELLLTDIKHILGSSPLRPAYRKAPVDSGTPGDSPSSAWVPVEGGIFELGAEGDRFSWDNERPRHRTLVSEFLLQDRLVTCGEYTEFMSDGGYQNPLLWLSDGWDWVNAEGIDSPLYWERDGDRWSMVTLEGTKPVTTSEPVCHVSFYEASAYARWRGKRLPTEAEWEKASLLVSKPVSSGNFIESGFLHPRPASAGGAGEGLLRQMFGDVWEWTGSAYLPYPGYQPEPGPLGEYNGKFMNNQMVLRGGSCATPASHIRRTYRNFFQGEKQWQFSGIRLAADPS